MGKNSQFLQLISYYEHLITQYENKCWKKVKKDEITEYVISKIVPPKVLLLRDIPTLRLYCASLIYFWSEAIC
jgi:hypothetical protein